MRLFTIIFVIFYSTCIPQQQLSIESQYIPHTDTCLVFTPSDYDETVKYPVIFLLHGWEASYRQWSEITDLNKLANYYDFIFVCPDGFTDSWYVNNPLRPGLQIADFFIMDLIPFILDEYSIDRNKVFISGLSMGGFGAVSFFLDNQNIFRSCASTSGIMNIKTFKNNWGMSLAFGLYEQHPLNYSKFNPIEKLDKIEDIKPFLIDCGTEDRIFVTNKEFFEKCQQNKIPITFIAQPGIHNKKYWAKAIIQHLNYFKNVIIGD